MYSTDWIAGNDLSLTFDGQGRLWRFRPTKTYGRQVHATIEDTNLLITVDAPGVRPGDLHVELDDTVLSIVDGATASAPTTVGLPKRAELHTLQTSYDDGVFEVRVPLVPAAASVAAEAEAVRVAC